jgi:hypothetical protein
MLLRVLFRIVREDKSLFSEEVRYRESIFLKVLGESKPGRISSPSLPLHMLLLASVAFAPNAAPDNDENELFLRALRNPLSRVTETESSELTEETASEGEGNLW